MEFLIVWGCSCICSTIMHLGNILRIFKDAADEGYMIDMDKINEMGGNTEDNSLRKVAHITLLIPGINLLSVLSYAVKYNEHKDDIMHRFDMMGALKNMTEEEKEQYNKKPTILNAVGINMNNDYKLKTGPSIKICEDSGESEIFYKSNEETKEIEILKVVGPISRLYPEELKKIANAANEKSIRIGVQKIKYSNSTFKELLGEEYLFDIDFNDSKLIAKKALKHLEWQEAADIAEKEINAESEQMTDELYDTLIKIILSQSYSEDETDDNKIDINKELMLDETITNNNIEETEELKQDESISENDTDEYIPRLKRK